MKKIFVILFIMLSVNSFCQTVEKRPIKDTIIKGATYPLYVGAKGGRYIIITSKTGVVYRKYFKYKPK